MIKYVDELAGLAIYSARAELKGGHIASFTIVANTQGEAMAIAEEYTEANYPSTRSTRVFVTRSFVVSQDNK